MTKKVSLILIASVILAIICIGLCYKSMQNYKSSTDGAVYEGYTEHHT